MITHISDQLSIYATGDGGAQLLFNNSQLTLTTDECEQLGRFLLNLARLRVYSCAVTPAREQI